MEAEYTPVSGEAHFSMELGTEVIELEVPAGATGLLIQLEEVHGRLTLDNSDPSWTSSPPLGFRILADTVPWAIPAGTNTTIKIVGKSSGGVIQCQWIE